MELVYRNANLEDLPLIIAIYNSTIPGRMVTADLEPVSAESRLEWFQSHGAHRPLWMVEDEKKKIVGWVSLQSFYGRPAYNATAEVSIYLHPDCRGAGLGKKILQHCITVAPHYGIKTLLGFIFAHNIPSLKLFTQAGFEEWAHLPNIAVLDEEERSLKILGKRIA